MAVRAWTDEEVSKRAWVATALRADHRALAARFWDAVECLGLTGHPIIEPTTVKRWLRRQLEGLGGADGGKP